MTIEKRELMQISLYELSGSQNSSIGAEAADIYNKIEWQ